MNQTGAVAALHPVNLLEPELRAVVVVKKTYALAPDGRLSLAEDPMPLVADQLVTDFGVFHGEIFFRKRGSDVCVLGTARFDRAATRGSADMGVNCAFVMNLNMQCQDFPIPPAPTGFCFTIHDNVMAGFSLADFCRGVVQWLVDLALTWLVGLVSAGLSAAVKGLVTKLMGNEAFMSVAWSAFKGNFTFTSAAGVRSAMGLMRDGAGFFASSGRLFVDGWRAIPAALANSWKDAPVDQTVGLVGTAAGTFGLGTPIGYAPKDAAVGGYGDHTVSTGVGKWVDGLFR